MLCGPISPLKEPLGIVGSTYRKLEPRAELLFGKFLQFMASRPTALASPARVAGSHHVGPLPDTWLTSQRAQYGLIKGIDHKVCRDPESHVYSFIKPLRGSLGSEHFVLGFHRGYLELEGQ